MTSFDDLREMISDPDLLPQRRKHYGLFYGIVESNADPQMLGRLRVRTPHYINVPVSMLPWASYSSPGGGGSDGVGFYFMPVVGSLVCVSFIGGDPEFPVWLGAVPSAPGRTAETHVSKIEPTAPYGLPVTDWDFTRFNSITTPSGHRIVLDDNKPTQGVGANSRRILIESSAGHYFRMIESKNLIPGQDKAMIELATVRGDKSSLRRIAMDDDLEVITVTGPDRVDSGVHQVEINSKLDYIQAKTSLGFALKIDDANKLIDLYTSGLGGVGKAHQLHLSNNDRRLWLKTIGNTFGLSSLDTAVGHMGMFSPFSESAQTRKASIMIDLLPYGGTQNRPAVILSAGDDINGSNGLVCDPGLPGMRPQSVFMYGAGSSAIGMPSGHRDAVWLVSKSMGTSNQDGDISIGRLDGTNTIKLLPQQSKITLSASGEFNATANSNMKFQCIELETQAITTTIKAATTLTLDAIQIIMKGELVHNYFHHYHPISLSAGINGALNAGLWGITISPGVFLPITELNPGTTFLNTEWPIGLM